MHWPSRFEQGQVRVLETASRERLGSSWLVDASMFPGLVWSGGEFQLDDTSCHARVLPAAKQDMEATEPLLGYLKGELANIVKLNPKPPPPQPGLRALVAFEGSYCWLLVVAQLLVISSFPSPA
jgi:hypothetical protein